MQLFIDSLMLCYDNIYSRWQGYGWLVGRRWGQLVTSIRCTGDHTLGFSQLVSWHSGRTLICELSMSYARPPADGNHLCDKSSEVKWLANYANSAFHTFEVDKWAASTRSGSRWHNAMNVGYITRMCATSLGWRHLVIVYGVKAGWLITFLHKRVW